jgi:hypothetical protein
MGARGYLPEPRRLQMNLLERTAAEEAAVFSTDA